VALLLLVRTQPANEDDTKRALRSAGTLSFKDVEVADSDFGTFFFGPADGRDA